ncbi:hypothetical protein WG66_009786 [Moniliophthora roreri]|uniref:Uncharacterized protein n=1 Tax=Moniliophthora roreri TaxID=221103 RepID=A0A0W0FUK9_MONRR|nr:hypothetical protein WG66_009786 [Moniliophthora roreri]
MAMEFGRQALISPFTTVRSTSLGIQYSELLNEVLQIGNGQPPKPQKASLQGVWKAADPQLSVSMIQ